MNIILNLTPSAASTCCFLLLPALLLVVVILWSTAGGRPLGAAVLLGLLQELVQAEGILLKLNGSLSPLPMICTWELFVWNKSDRKQDHHYGQFLQPAKHFVFYTVLQDTAGIQTFLEDNDKLLTKHTGQAMLGWWSVVMLPLGQLLQLGHHVRVFFFKRSQNKPERP